MYKTVESGEYYVRPFLDALSSSRCNAIYSEKSRERVEMSDVGPFHFTSTAFLN